MGRTCGRGDVVRLRADVVASRLPWARPTVLAGTPGVVVGDESFTGWVEVRFDTGRTTTVRANLLDVVERAHNTRSGNIFLPW